jgi:hypothetical protein
MIALKEQLESTNPRLIIETAMMVVPKILDLDDPQDAAVRFIEVAELQQSDLQVVESLARNASKGSGKDIVDLTKSVLLDVANKEIKGRERVTDALESAGRKQSVIGPDTYYLCAFLVVLYATYLSRGRLSEKRSMTIEESKNGKTKVTIGEQITYLSPFTAMAGLLEKIVKPNSPK